MEPNKFDKDIKSILEKRTLQPSTDAWNKLSNKLDAQDNKKKVKPIWWLGLAASIVGILFVVTVFFNSEKPTEGTPELTETPKIIEKNNTIKVASEEVESLEKSIEVNNKNEEPQRKVNINKEKINKKINQETQIAKTTKPMQINEKDIALNPTNVLKENTSLETKKIQEIVAIVQELKDSNTVTDAKIDALLAEAQKEIRMQKLQDQTTQVVDANMLLQDVEADLEQSFRSKVFEAIKASYSSVKTAVAQRNN